VKRRYDFKLKNEIAKKTLITMHCYGSEDSISRLKTFPFLITLYENTGYQNGPCLSIQKTRGAIQEERWKNWHCG
jgi:hypothetical protein